MANQFSATVPQLDFSSLGELPATYKAAAKERTLADLGKGLADGTVDYKQAGATLASLGDIGNGLSLMKLGAQQKAGDKFMSDLKPMYGGQPAATAPTTQPAAAGYDGAISSIESGGKYDALGPVTKTGDRAYGKYQVMGTNVGPWTKEVLGQELTPAQFAASPEAQDKVFQAKFGNLAQKYGPEGAARAWFAGEGGMNDLGRKDQLGTTVGQYGQKFTAALGPQVASLDPAAGTAQPVAASAPQGTQVAQSQPAQPAVNGVQISPRVGQLISAMADPMLPEGHKKIAETLLTRELDNAKLPDSVKQYIFAKGQGYGGSYVEYQTEIRRAGATNVNVGDNSKKFDEEFDKKAADRFGKYIDNADSARRKMVDIGTMREISQRLGVQGAAAGVKEAIGPYADALGINVDGLSDIQAYTQVIQRLAPQQRAPGSGSTSDVEFKGFLKSLPGLSQNPAAREMGLNTMEALSRDEIARGEIASRLSTKEINRVQAEKELRELPDPMKGFVAWRKSNPDVFGQALKGGATAPPPTAGAPAQQSAPRAPVPVKDRAGYDALKSGDTYTAPDGSIRTKQ